MIRVLLTLLTCLLIISPARAQNAPGGFDYSTLRALPVLHDGRIKPLDSFARTLLGTFAGQDHLPGMSASTWLAETVFDPAGAIERPVFYIPTPGLLNLPLQPRRLYSFAQLSPALQAKMPVITTLATQDETEWSADGRALMDLHQRSVLYTQLLRSFTGILPLAIDLPDSIRRAWNITDDNAPRTLNDFRPYVPRIEARIKKIIAAKGDDFSRYTDEEKDIATLGWQLQILEQAGQQNILLRIIPPQWGGDEWLSPWALNQTGKGAPQANDYLAQWAAMARAWHMNDNAAWKEAASTAHASVMAMDNTGITPWKLSAELFYTSLHPAGSAMLCYLLAFLALIGASVRYRDMLLRAAFAGIVLGALIHMTGIILRVIILERPPVGTLYESILFVALICVIGGLATGRRLKDTTGLFIASLGGGLLLFTARAFTPDDTMQMLVAVLNTNFWLATHVLCITIGYGWCVIAAILGHLSLYASARGKKIMADTLQPALKTTALCALLFTTVGTILGGIWADQSWGRFWGWDPKENGALLIVLWLIWILHGRISGDITRLGFMAGNAALGIIVALAWFGVNLLSTGLHSYGFIEGVAAGLLSFCAGESALIGALWYYARKPQKAAS